MAKYKETDNTSTTGHEYIRYMLGRDNSTSADRCVIYMSILIGIFIGIILSKYL